MSLLPTSKTGARTRAALVAVAAGLAMPAMASAAITSSNITSPVGPWYALDHNEVSPDPTVTITGTTNSTAPGTDTVDLECTYDRTQSTTLASGVTLTASGEFSAVVPFDSFPDDQVCYIRAIPPGWANNGEEGAQGDFSGPLASVGDVFISRVASGPNTGKIRYFGFDALGPQGMFLIDPVGTAGPHDIRGFASDLRKTDDAGNWGFALRSRSSIDASRSALMVDGVSAYTMRSAREKRDDQAPGFPNVDLSWGLDARGIPTLTEKSDVVKCDDEANCTAFVPIGLRLDRTYTFHAEGRIAIIRDVFVSTDGAAHAVRADYAVDTNEGDMGISFDGSQRLTEIGNSSPLMPFTGGLTSGFALRDDPPFMRKGRALGRTWRQIPQVVYGFGNRGAATVSPFTFTVPAGGEHVIENALQGGYGLEWVVDAMLRTEDMWSSPTTTIGFPASGATVTGNWVWVTGQSQARKVFGTFSTPQVSVNGRAATVAPDGSWSVALPLAAGTNTITATATNSAGNTGTASVTLTGTESGGQITAQSAVKLTRSVFSRSGNRRITIGGKLTPPAGVPKANACTGWVQVKTMRGKQRLGATWAAVRTDCTWQANVVAPVRGRATVTSRFNGNSYVLPIAAAPMSIAARHVTRVPVTG